MFRTRILALVSSLLLCTVSAVGYAEQSVIGQLKAELSVVLNPGAKQHRTGKGSTAYLKGDVIATGANSSATLALSSSGVLTIAPDSLISVDSAAPVVINLRNGGVGFSVGAGNELSIVSPEGEFIVTSDLGASVVAVYKDGELGIVSNSGSVLVGSESGDTIAVVNEQHAFVISRSNQSQVVNVQLGGGASFWSQYKWWLAAFGAVGAGLIIDNNSGSSSPAASPVN